MPDVNGRFRGSGWSRAREDGWERAFESVHTIPVPRGWSPEQSWEAIARGDELTDLEPAWANVVIRDGRFAALLKS